MGSEDVVSWAPIGQDGESRDICEMLLRHMSQGFALHEVVLDDAGRPVDYRFLRVNPAFEEQTGVRAAETVGRRACEVLPWIRETELLEIFGKVALSGEPRQFEYPCPPLGHHYLINAFSPKPGWFAIIMTDITEQRRLEGQLVRAQRLELAGRIAGQVAHDVNNLLSPLVAYPTLIKMQLDESHPAQEFCDTMLQSAQQIADITADLLTLGRRGHFSPEPTDLNQLVRQAIGEQAGLPKTLDVELDLEEDLHPVAAAPSQLRRVLTNLILNAREAMSDLGRLTLRSHNVRLEGVVGRHGPVADGEYALVEVRDTGCGIPVEARERIFEPFFTTKRADRRRGSGLGLSIVEAVLADHRGHLELASEVGVGTTISLYFPSCSPAAIAAARSEASGGSESILVVDDDPIQRETIGGLLRSLGYRVDAVDSGTAALAYLEKRPVDLLVLDIVMEGLDGAETYRRAVAVRPGQRAVFVSGFAECGRIRRARALGVDGYVRKPVTLEKLARAVRTALYSPRPDALA